MITLFLLIINFGKKAFDLISQKFQEPPYLPQKYVNLTADSSFRENAIKLLIDIITYDSSRKKKILPESYENDGTMYEDTE